MPGTRVLDKMLPQSCIKTPLMCMPGVKYHTPPLHTMSAYIEPASYWPMEEMLAGRLQKYVAYLYEINKMPPADRARKVESTCIAITSFIHRTNDGIRDGTVRPAFLYQMVNGILPLFLSVVSAYNEDITSKTTVIGLTALGYCFVGRHESGALDEGMQDFYHALIRQTERVCSRSVAFKMCARIESSIDTPAADNQYLSKEAKEAKEAIRQSFANIPSTM